MASSDFDFLNNQPPATKRPQPKKTVAVKASKQGAQMVMQKLAGKKPSQTVIGLCAIGGLAAFALVCVIFYWAFGLGSSSSSVDGIPVQVYLDRSLSTTTIGEMITTPPKSTSMSSLDREAVLQVLNLFKAVKIGNSHYVCEIKTHQNSFSSNNKIIKLETVTEIREPVIEIQRCEGKQLSEGQRLNGEEWNGRVEICYHATRQYPQYEFARTLGQKCDDHWTGWEDGKTTGMNGMVHYKTAFGKKMVRVNGKWTFPGGQEANEYRKITKQDIPK